MEQTSSLRNKVEPGLYCVQVVQEQFDRHQDVYLHLIAQSLPSIGAESPFLFGNIVKAIGEGKLEIWLAMRVGGEKSGMRCVATLMDSIDPITGAPSLTVYTFTPVDMTREDFEEMCSFIKAEAKRRGRFMVMGFTSKLGLAKAAEKAGFSVGYTLRMEV